MGKKLFLMIFLFLFSSAHDKYALSIDECKKNEILYRKYDSIEKTVHLILNLKDVLFVLDTLTLPQYKETFSVHLKKILRKLELKKLALMRANSYCNSYFLEKRFIKNQISFGDIDVFVSYNKIFVNYLRTEKPSDINIKKIPCSLKKELIFLGIKDKFLKDYCSYLNRGFNSLKVKDFLIFRFSEGDKNER